MQENVCLMWPWMIFCIMGIIGLPLNLIKAIVSIDFGSPNAGNYLPGVIFGIIATLVNMFLVIYLFLVVWNYKRELEAGTVHNEAVMPTTYYTPVVTSPPGPPNKSHYTCKSAGYCLYILCCEATI